MPTDVIPISYDLKFVPNFDTFTFEGFAQIVTRVENPTNNITLHVGNIEIDEMSFDIYLPGVLSYTYDNITEKYTITCPEILKKDRHVGIYFSYHGTLNDNMIGFYRSSYYDEDGIK